MYLRKKGKLRGAHDVIFPISSSSRAVVFWCSDVIKIHVGHYVEHQEILLHLVYGVGKTTVENNE